MAKPLRIMVVDDDITVLELLDAVLRNRFQVSIHSSTSGLLDLMEFDRPDIVLLDVRMPGEGGMKVLRRIRTKRTLERVIVLLMSSKVSLEEKILGVELGATVFMAKPIDLDLLRQELEEAEFPRRYSRFPRAVGRRSWLGDI